MATPFDRCIIPLGSARDARGPGPRGGRLAQTVSGVLFGMGGVLYDDSVWRRWLLRLLGQLGLHTNYRSFYRVWDREFLKAVQSGQTELCQAFRIFLRSVGLTPAQIDEVEAACQARRRRLEESTRALPGVKATLARLYQSGLTLGVLANSEHPSEVLQERLERMGLGGLFQVVLSSLDLRRTKPDLACYRTALAALKLGSHEVAYVGNESDELAGAARVGLYTVGFNYDPDAQADAFIARFEELAEVVEPRRPMAAAG